MDPQTLAAGTLAEFEEVAYLIAQARRKVWRAVARVFAAEGEAVLGWALVSVLVRFGPQSQRDLADIIGQHPAGISRQLSELDAANITTRAEDASDRRRHLVALTPSGRLWYRRNRPRVLTAIRDVLGVLDRRERETLQRLLHQVLAPRTPDTPTRGRSAVRSRGRKR